MNMIIKNTILTLILTTLFPFLSSSALAAGDSDPYQVVNIASKTLITAIEEGQGYFENDPEKFYTTITHILDPVVNFPRISRGVMGKFFKPATPEQRIQFLAQFKKALIRLYSKTFLSLGVENIEIVGAEPVNKSLKKRAVNMKVRTTNGSSYSLIYTMKKSPEGTWLVHNMIIDGINLGLVYRNQFMGAMKQHQDDMDKVIKNWLIIVSKKAHSEAS